jgi:pimeloyl-ACP methyl ester carboxylesterase
MSECIESNIGGTRVLQQGTGFPLLFVHGFTTTAEFWRHQAASLSDKYRVIRIELRGHGKADHHPDQAFSIDAYARDVLSVIDKLGLDRYILIGLSMGGTVAQTVTLSRPRGLVGLVLVGATAHGLGPDVQADNVIAAIRRIGIHQSAQDVIDASFAASTSQDLVAWARSEVTQTPEYVAVQAIRSLNDTDNRARLGHVEVPTLIVAGEDDRITPVGESEHLAELIPGAELAVIKAAAHFPMLEQPVKFNEVFEEFVERLLVRAA